MDQTWKSTLLSLITGLTKATDKIYNCFGIRGSGETIWDIKKKLGIFSTAMTDLFQNDSAKYGLSGFFDSIGCMCNNAITKKRVAEWLSLVAMTEYKINYFAIYQC
jgi:molybdate transport system ATP-binding protein